MNYGLRLFLFFYAYYVVCRTALAEAELEYKSDHRTTAVTVRIPLMNVPDDWKCDGHQVYALVWTTTPWTLAANKAIAYNQTLEYALISVNGSKDNYIIATELLDQFAKSTKMWVDVIKTFSGKLISLLTYKMFYLIYHYYRLYDCVDVWSNQNG